MKTLQDLVDKLNEVDEGEGFYDLSEDDEGIVRIDYRIANQEWSITAFDKLNRKILLTSNKHIMNWQEMYWVSKYALEHTYEDWFPEKKYNIIIGQDNDDDETEIFFTAYYKQHNAFYTNDSTREDKLSYECYIFTESEIEELKSTLPENMAKIVDLGKTEVKYE